MKTKKPTLIIAIFFFCAGMAWSQNKSLSDVYKMNITVLANNISPETTSMLCLVGEVRASIIFFDGNRVDWRIAAIGNSSKEFNGVIVPSGLHSIVTNTNNPPVVFDFKPNRFYLLYYPDYLGNRANITVVDVTNDINWSNEKAQMEQVIRQYAGQTAQGSGGSGIQGALSRAAKTVMANLKQDGDVAIISFSAPDRDSAQFVQEELEVILVNNGFHVVDRASLDKVRQEQKFQFTQEVDDQTAVKAGMFAGAKMVITGSVSGSGDMRRLRLRALDAETARVLASASEPF